MSAATGIAPGARLAGKVIVVAGGGGGTGEATSLRLGAEGARIVVGDKNPATAADVAERIRAGGGIAEPFAFDMGDGASTAELARFAVSTFGRLDGLHNIAGNPEAHAGDLDLTTTSLETWERQLRSHLLAYAQACRAAIPLMLENGGGAIVNTSSAASRSAGIDRIGYQTAKAGVETMTRHIAARYGKQGIRCNAICYGVILTENARARLPREFLDQALASTWSPRLGRPDDVAGLAALLFSDEGEWINGQVIDVNGGRLLGP
jgi:NAD(P)-dependent dehydrogenase (short-subunit alcohol dehydrogenase family)